MSDQHLGDLSAALVDNALSHDARDKALAHLTRCAECRTEVDAQRRLRSLLANQPDPEPSADLIARLRGLSSGESLGSPAQHRTGRRWPLVAAAFTPSQRRPSGVRRPRDTGPADRPVRLRKRPVVRRALAGSAAAFALTAGLAAAGGPTASSGPSTRPPVERFVQEHTMMTARLPFGDAGAGVVEFVVLGR
jgi:anti-sigma factor RsiW